MQNPIFKEIYNSNPTRSLDHYVRKSLKLCEETGELAQAVLSITSDANIKNKTRADVLEEVVDVFIVASDLLFTRFEDEVDMSEAELEQSRIEVINKKLNRWKQRMALIKNNKDGTTN
jgi:NTP pyrophosphatase (non-canonical NTP hydrolase)